MVKLTLHCLSKDVTLPEFQLDLRQLLVEKTEKKKRKKKVLLLVDFVYECVHGTARWGVFAISMYIKLKTSLNICVEF